MSLLSRLRNALLPTRLDTEIEEELQQHLEHRRRQWIDAGMTEEAAEAKARRDFGNPTLLHERSRELRLSVFLESTLQDVRFALRGMRRNPGFFATAVLSLGLAIGAVAAIYAIVAAAVLRPLPVHQPQDLILLTTDNIQPAHAGEPAESASFNYPLFRELRKTGESMGDLALFTRARPIELRRESALTGIKVMHAFVGGNGFRVLGVAPAIGRLLSKADDVIPNGSPVAVISYAFWRRHYGLDPSIIGKPFSMDSRTYTLIGVTAEGFFGVEPDKSVDVWTPAATYNAKAFESSYWYWFFVIGRSAPNRWNRLEAALQPVYHRHQEDRIKRFSTMPEAIRNQFLRTHIHVRSGARGISIFREQFEKPMWIVMVVASCLMLIACANVASLILARGAARRAEIAMRISLGASRFRLMRQLLTESLLLACIAGGLGWLLARALAPLLVASLSRSDAPIQFSLALDTRTLLFCLLISTLCALLFGSMPAWQSSDTRPASTLRSSGGEASKLRLGRLFVSLQVAGAFFLVTIGSAFLLTMWHLLTARTGFDPQHVLVLQVLGDQTGDPKPGQQDRVEGLRTAFMARNRVESAAVASWPVFSHSGWEEQVMITGKANQEREEIFYPVSPDYFKTVRTPLLAGRDFSSGDRLDREPVASVVNVAFAKRYFQTTEVLGREFFRPGNLDSRSKLIRHVIVGVAADSSYNGLREGFEPIAYMPPTNNANFTMYIRSTLKPEEVVRSLEAEMRSRAFTAHVTEILTLDGLVGNSALREKLLAGLGGAFGVFGLMIASVGIFGLLNYSVQRRTKELGIRSALGATAGSLIGLVTQDLIRLAALGLLIGIVGSAAAMPLLRSLFFGIKEVDPAVMGTGAACLLFACALAGGLPARRAASIDPNVALREE